MAAIEFAPISDKSSCVRIRRGYAGLGFFGICARRKQLDRGVQVCEARPLARNPFFEVVNVAADFSALEAKCGNYMGIGHPSNLGADPIHAI